MNNSDMNDLQKQIFQKMTPEERLCNAERLYYSARAFKAAALQAFHPEWDNKQLQEAVRKSFLYAQS